MTWLRRRRRSPASNWPRQLKITREGKLLIGLTLGLGFGALNSGNNLLYLILGMLLSMIVVSGILSELCLRGIVVRRRFHAAVHAGRETFLSLEVTNEKRRLGSFSIEVEEILDSDLATQRPAYALVLRPGETLQIALRLLATRRGAHISSGLRIATRYPFGFFRKSRVVQAPLEIVAYPAVHPVSAPYLGVFSDGALDSHRRVGRGGEYHGLREHSHDDDPRDIHWKSSARLGRLVTREYERLADRRLWLLVPNAIVAGGDERARLEEAEASISEAASLAMHYAGSGWAVGLTTLDGSVEPGSGPGHLVAILEHLARVPVHAGKEAVLGWNPTPGGLRGARLLVRHRGQVGLSLEGHAERTHEVSTVAV